MNIEAAQHSVSNASSHRQDLSALFRLAAKLGFSRTEIRELRQTYGSAFELDGSQNELSDEKGRVQK